MDKTKNIETADLVVEEHIRRGWTVIEIPAHLFAELREANEEDSTIPVWPAIRLTKLTHKVRRDIAVEVQRRYNSDLQDTSLLSTAQLMELTTKRGEWTKTDSKKIAELQAKVGSLMRELTAPAGEEHMAWASDLTKTYEKLSADIQAQVPELFLTFTRWANFDTSAQAEYDRLYAEGQGQSQYSPEKDFQFLAEKIPFELLDNLETVSVLSTRLQMFMELERTQVELRDLLQKENKIFSESVENRRENAESLVRLAHIAQWADLDGTPRGALKNPDTLPERLLEWMLIETHFFVQNIPPETREYLQKWGFLPAPLVSGSSKSSDESPVEPNSNSDSEPSTKTPAVSSE